MNQAPTSAKDPRLCAPPSPVVCPDGRCFSYSMVLQQAGGGLAEGTERQDTGNARGVSSEKYANRRELPRGRTCDLRFAFGSTVRTTCCGSVGCRRCGATGGPERMAIQPSIRQDREAFAMSGL